jgi:hypothetical protein
MEHDGDCMRVPEKLYRRNVRFDRQRQRFVTAIAMAASGVKLEPPPSQCPRSVSVHKILRGDAPAGLPGSDRRHRTRSFQARGRMLLSSTMAIVMYTLALGSSLERSANSVRTYKRPHVSARLSSLASLPRQVPTARMGTDDHAGLS